MVAGPGAARQFAAGIVIVHFDERSCHHVGHEPGRESAATFLLQHFYRRSLRLLHFLTIFGNFAMSGHTARL
jgi:hypothetical protein